jgi:hypothetical protein
MVFAGGTYTVDIIIREKKNAFCTSAEVTYPNKTATTHEQEGREGGEKKKKTGGRTHGTAVDLRCYGKKKKERAYETTEKTKAQERQRNVHAQAITQTLTKKKKNTLAFRRPARGHQQP